MKKPKLRDSGKNSVFELYPLGMIPERVVVSIGKWIVYYFCVGKSDINGEDWGDIFAKSLNGQHLSSPVGLADVVHEQMAWSVKSVKLENPHSAKKARIISGRCSPDYSYGISDPHQDVQATGRAVLGIWNERINIAKDKFEPLRSALLVRNPLKLEFTLYECELERYNTNDYVWHENKNGNLEGKLRQTGRHCFTWQPHGSQFTIICQIPVSAIKFKIKRPPTLNFHKTLEQIGFDEKWITIIDSV